MFQEQGTAIKIKNTQYELFKNEESHRNVIQSDAFQSFPLYNYAIIFSLLAAARRAGTLAFRKASWDKNGRNRSGEVALKAIDVHWWMRIRDVYKSSGYDENFCKEFFFDTRGKTNYVDILDQEFGIANNPVNFNLVFRYSRFPTNSYIHFMFVKKSQNVTYNRTISTGHSGGFFMPLPLEITGAEEIRTASVDAIKRFLRTTGEHKVGSVGNSPGYFHYDRQVVINNVIEEARRGDQKLKSESPIKATIEALKFVVNHTIGYRDDVPENNNKFVGMTTDGLNVADPVSRQYALKHYQAVRDAAKLAILSHENRFNDVDSDAECDSVVSVSTDIDRLNRKLTRTKLEEKYHGNRPRKTTLSPLRYDSPYSRANVDISISMLKAARTYQDISAVYHSPIPVIHPTDKIFAAEDAKRSAAVRSSRAAGGMFAAAPSIAVAEGGGIDVLRSVCAQKKR